jgi:hypothetical protein
MLVSDKSGHIQGLGGVVLKTYNRNLSVYIKKKKKKEIS